MNFITVLSH